MDCKTCRNYEPMKVERPDDHPGRIFAEDLQIGMVIRRRGTKHPRKLIVILGKVECHLVPSLQLLAGYKPRECTTMLADCGLKAYDNGEWREGAWCDEVT